MKKKGGTRSPYQETFRKSPSESVVRDMIKRTVSTVGSLDVVRAVPSTLAGLGFDPRVTPRKLLRADTVSRLSQMVANAVIAIVEPLLKSNF